MFFMTPFFLILFIFSVFFFSTNQFSEAEVDSSITRQGMFAMLDSMLPDGSHQVPSYFLLTEDDGVQNMYKLTFAITPENPQSLSGKKVIVQGHLSSERFLSANEQQIETIDTHVIHEIPSDEIRSGSSMEPSAAVTGTENIQTLLVKYPDVVNESHNSAYFAERFYTATDSLNNFYKTSSYNKFSITGTSNDWKTLPSSKSAYLSGGTIIWSKIIQDAIQAHKGTVNFSNVDGIIIVTNDCADSSCAGYGYLGKLNWNGGTGIGIKNIRVSLLPDQTSTFWCCGPSLSKGLFVAAHELGHNLTLDHTPPPPGLWTATAPGFSYNDPYHDPWSAMSAAYDYESATGMIMGQRDSIGWVSTTNKVTIPRGTSNTITLDTINQSQSGSNPQMAFVPLPDGTKYILEARKDGTFDDTPLDNEGIVIYKFFPNGNKYSYLTFYLPDKNAKYSLVATSGTSVVTDFTTANLDVHESWTDSNQVYVKTVSKTSTSVTVFVSNAGPLPPTTVPEAPVSLTNSDIYFDSVDLTWTAPDDGGSPITDYIIEYKLSADTSYTTFDDGTSTDVFATVTGLTNDESYDFKVSAVNAIGTGSPELISSTPIAIPDAPTSLIATSGDSEVLLSWTAPDDGGSPITDYIIEYKLSADTSYTTFDDGTSTDVFATVTGLTNDESYDFKVSAVNAIGTGLASDIASATSTVPFDIELVVQGTATLKKPVTKGDATFEAGDYTVEILLFADIESINEKTGIPKFVKGSISGTYSVVGDVDSAEGELTNVKITVSKGNKIIKWTAKEGSGEIKFATKIDFNEPEDQDGKSSKITKLKVGKATFAPKAKTTTSNISFS